MVNESARDPIKTRQKSAQEGRRNSVSELTELFQSQDLIPTPKDSMAPRKTSGKSAKDREKDKERAKEVKIVKENIKTLIMNMDKENSPNTNGGAPQHVEESTNRDEPLNDRSPNDSSQEDSTIPSQDALNELDTQEDSTRNANSKSNTIATQTNEDEILVALKELADKYEKLEQKIEHPKNGLTVQLAKTQATVTDLYSDINGAVSGLKVQMTKVTETAMANVETIQKMQDNQKKMSALFDENKRLISELKIMQGLVQKTAQQTAVNSTQILDITRRGMEQNLIIQGIDNRIELEDPKKDPPFFKPNERCKYAALDFFKEIMNISLSIEDIWKAHRVGAHKQGKVRPMVIKLSYSAKDLIMENIPSLKGKSNPTTNQVYFISEQSPEGVTEPKKQASNRTKSLREVNDKKPKEQRDNIQVINDKVLVNGDICEPEVLPPQPSQLFLDPQAQGRVDVMQHQLCEIEPEYVRNSEFLALAAKVKTIQEVNDAYIAVAQRYPLADHIMMAYALKEGDQLKTGFCDDKEYGAGHRIKKIIFEQKAKDTAVFVLRKYGGIHLGFGRFAVIQSMAKKAITSLYE